MQKTIQGNGQMILSSPFAGKIVKILARDGERVFAGQDVVIMESMKMLYTLPAGKTGKMIHLCVQEGDLVPPEMQLAQII